MYAPKWIVVAEDEEAVRELWCDVLSGAGHRVLGARNGFEALDLIRSVVPDLVLLDLRMPGLSGPDFMRYLGASPALRRIPVLGWLFKRTLKQDRKEELLVFITPQVVAGYGAELPSAMELWENRQTSFGSGGLAASYQ